MSIGDHFIMFIRIFEKNTRSDRIFFRSAVGGGAKRRPDLVGIGGHWSLVTWTMDNGQSDPRSSILDPRSLSALVIAVDAKDILQLHGLAFV